MNESISKPLNQSIKQSVQPSRQNIIKNIPADRSSLNQVYEQQTPSIIVEDYDKPKLSKKYKIISGVGICFLVLGLIFFLLLPPIIYSQIVKLAIQQAVLSKDNQNFWAHFPGQSKTIITRNYSFYNFTNPQQFFLLGEKPRFRQIEGYIITQLEDFLDIQYFQNDNKVRMKDWLHFDYHQDSRSLNEKFNIINAPSLGFWYQLKNSKDCAIFIQGFASLFTNIQQSLIVTVLGQGVSSQYLPDYKTAYVQLFKPAGISRQNSRFLWDDLAYGFGDKNNLKYWVEAAQKSFNQNQTSFSDEALYLKDYFTLSDFQLYYILTEINSYSDSLKELILDNHYCANVTKCDGHQLAVRQIASSYVTYNTPPVSSITPTDTICTDNQTCSGNYPQLAAYYKNIYLIQHPEADPFLTFDESMVRKWVNYNPSGRQGQYNKAQNCIMHIGNLEALFDNGTLHDRTKTQHIDYTQYLINIKNRFQLPTQSHTLVFWEWIKYLVSNLIRQKTQGNQKVGISNSFTSGLYQSFSYIQDNLQFYLLRTMIRNKLGSQTCDGLISTSFQSNNATLIQNICNSYNHNIQSQLFINDSIKICRNKYRDSWKKFMQLGATTLNLQSFCDKSINSGFGELYHLMKKQLNDYYECDQTPNQYCSDYQLALKQWANSSVTSNLTTSVYNSLEPTITFNTWDQNSFPIQLPYFSNKSKRQKPQVQMQEAYHLFNFENIFSVTLNIRRFGNQSVDQYWKNYMRYIVVFVGFKGLTNQRTAYQYIFGYNDEYLLWRKNNYPPFGGDPSTPAYVAFNDLNISKQQVTLELEWYTGKEDSNKTAQYYKINNLTYLTTNYTYFNGNETYWALEDPWEQRDYFYGTNGKTFSPDQRNSKFVSIYVPNLQRYGRGSLQQSYPYQRYGYDLDIAYLGRYIYETGQQYPDNKKYYQNYFGVFNQTSVLGFPFFMTKHHFMNCTSNWSSYIKVFNEDETIQFIQASHWDDSYVIVQPFSGVSFQSTLYLQANYYYEPDQLFIADHSFMLPVFAIYRSGNLTKEKADELFGPLTTALSIKTVCFYIGIILTLIGVGTFSYGFYNIKRIQKINSQQKIKNSVKISMQPQINKKDKIKQKENEETMKQKLIKQQIQDNQD